MGLIDGKALAEIIRTETSVNARIFVDDTKRRAKLVCVLVGTNPASEAYVNAKIKACKRSNVFAKIERYDERIHESVLLEEIQKFNEDPEVDGIIVQLPLPSHLQTNVVLDTISPLKDVDGLTPHNAGLIASTTPSLIPATPLAVMKILEMSKTKTEGVDAVVVGRSRLVGMPLAQLLVESRATVTICHSATNDLKAHTRRADILIAAVGVPNLITADMVKKGAVVIDVGINRVDDSSVPKGYRLVGDVDFEGVSSVASAITPVPGGVGPMTVAMLVDNVVKAAEMRRMVA